MLITEWEGSVDVGFKASDKEKWVLNGEKDKEHLFKGRFEISVLLPQL